MSEPVAGGAVSQLSETYTIRTGVDMTSASQQAVAQRPPIRVFRQASQDRQWRTRPQEVGVRHTWKG